MLGNHLLDNRDGDPADFLIAGEHESATIERHQGAQLMTTGVHPLIKGDGIRPPTLAIGQAQIKVAAPKSTPAR